jgi:type II secretory pathway pseudopilin PulG
MRCCFRKVAGSGLDRLRVKNTHTRSRLTPAFDVRTKPSAPRSRAFTLVEVVIVLALVIIVILGAFNTIRFMNFSSHRLSDTTAALAVVQAKVEEIRAATYNPPLYPFSASTNNYITNNVAISLDQSGTTFRVPGVLVSSIQPVAQGHLITVTGTFTNADQYLNPSFTVSLQTVVNRFSGGQQ